jgi:hypothetical protein
VDSASTVRGQDSSYQASGPQTALNSAYNNQQDLNELGVGCVARNYVVGLNGATRAAQSGEQIEKETLGNGKPDLGFFEGVISTFSDLWSTANNLHTC